MCPPPTLSQDTDQPLGVWGKGQTVCTQSWGKPSKVTAPTEEDVPWYWLSAHTARTALAPGWWDAPLPACLPVRWAWSAVHNSST